MLTKNSINSTQIKIASMTKSSFIIIMSIISIFSYGQTANNTNRKNESNIYNQSFIQYFKFLKNKNLPDTLFIEEDYKLTDSLMTTIGKTRLVCIKTSDVEKTVKLNNSMVLYRLFPLTYNNHEFSIAFIPFGVTFSPSEGLFFSNHGSYWVFFEYNKGKFKFKRIDFYGI